MIIIGIGIWLTIRNKSKSQQLKDSEEKNKRLRIELVMVEEKVEDLDQELVYQQEMHNTYVTKHEKALVRSKATKSKISNIRAEANNRRLRKSLKR